jgi:hypothetical protein
MYNWLGLCGMDCILLLVTIVLPQIWYKDVEDYLLHRTEDREKKYNDIVNLLEVLISSRETTSITSWSTLLMICQKFAT